MLSRSHQRDQLSALRVRGAVLFTPGYSLLFWSVLLRCCRGAVGRCRRRARHNGVVGLDGDRVCSGHLQSVGRVQSFQFCLSFLLSRFLVSQQLLLIDNQSFGGPIRCYQACNRAQHSFPLPFLRRMSVERTDVHAFRSDALSLAPSPLFIEIPAALHGLDYGITTHAPLYPIPFLSKMNWYLRVTISPTSDGLLQKVILEHGDTLIHLAPHSCIAIDLLPNSILHR